MESRIEQVVMARTKRIRAARTIVSREALALLVAIAALWGIGREVWVARVFQNAPSLADFSASTRFWLAAFVDTRAVVQVLILAILIAAIYLMREFTKALRQQRPAFA